MSVKCGPLCAIACAPLLEDPPLYLICIGTCLSRCGDDPPGKNADCGCKRIVGESKSTGGVGNNSMGIGKH